MGTFTITVVRFPYFPRFEAKRQLSFSELASQLVRREYPPRSHSRFQDIRSRFVG